MIEKTQIKQIFREQFPFLTETALDALLSIATIKTFKNKETIIRFKQKTDTVSFVLKGMTRGFYVDEIGEEKTVFLRPTSTFFAPSEILDGQKPSRYQHDAVGETTLIIFSYADFEHLTKTDLSIARLLIEALKEVTLTLVFRVEMLAGKMPEERYAALLERHPQFFQKAYNKYIANYLGITPNSLSRIIKRRKEA